ncbi:MAG: hypothetical protein WA584_23565 [Pyrinomonadaceae bacterium]
MQFTKIENNAENRIFISMPEGQVELKGTSEFITKLFKEMCEGEYFLAYLRSNLEGITAEDIADEMRSGGFPDDVVSNFEQTAKAAGVGAVNKNE